jgi:hypothetical protein
MTPGVDVARGVQFGRHKPEERLQHRRQRSLIGGRSRGREGCDDDGSGDAFDTGLVGRGVYGCVGAGLRGVDRDLIDGGGSV